MSTLRQNVAGQRVFFVLINATTGAGLTGATVTVNRGIDGGAQAAATGTVTELGLGQYRFDPSQADTNGDHVGYIFTATNAIPVNANFVTTNANPHDGVSLGLSAVNSQVVGMNANVVTAAAIANAAIDAATFATGAIDAAAIATGAITSAKFAAGAIDAAAIAADAIGSSELAASAVNEIADQVWDEARLSHTIAGSMGETMNILALLDANTIAAAVWDKPTSVHTTIGTFGQRLQSNNAGAVSGAGGPGEINLDASAEGSDDYYNWQIVLITEGFGVGQARIIIDYEGAARKAIISPDWVFTPDATSEYVILPFGVMPAAMIAGAVWDETRAAHVTAGTFGEGVASVQGDITGNVNGNVVGSVGSIGANGINAASFAANSITSSALATSAVDEIVDQVWNEILSGHLGAGSTGEALNNAAAAAPTAAVIADAVWDELRAGHVIAGSFGEGVASVQGNVTGSVASVTGNVGGNITGSVGSVAANGITASSLDGTAIAEIADGVWDEDIVAAHGTADTSGLILSQLTKRAVTLSTAVLDGSVVGQILDDGTAVYDRTTDSLQAIRDALAAAGPTAAVIADAVWDELRAGHVIAGSFGEGVASVQGNVTGSTASVTGNVGGNVVGSVGSVAAGGITAASFAANAITAAALATSAVDEIVDQTWDEALAGHLSVGSTGEALNNAAAASPSAAVIADAVWDELRAGHVIAGSFGEGVASVQGNVTGSTASVTGSVGSVVGNVGGNVVGNVSGNVVGSVGSVALNGITAASLDVSAVNEIVDQVWDEILAGHLGVGSTGEALSNAAAASPSAATIADAVWDELRAGHVIAGSFGEGVASVQGNVTGSTASVTGNVGGNVVGSVGSVAAGGITAASFAANAITSAALATSAVDEIVDQTWDEALAGHLSVGSTGEALSNAAAASPSAAVIADAVWDELRAGHVIAGSFGEGVASVQGNVTGSTASVTGSVGSVVGNVGGNVVGNVNGNVVGSVGSVALNGITAASLDVSAINEIVDQTWDEILAGHLGVGSTGEALNNAGSGASAAVIADAVWDELRAGHVIAGSFGEGVASVQGNVTGSTASVTGSVGSVALNGITAASLDVSAINEIVDQTWDEILAGHLAAGSTGEALNNSAAASPSAATIADAVWDEALAGHVIAGSAGFAENLIDDTLAAVVNVQGRVPLTLNGGRMRSHVEACDPPCTPTGGGGGAVDTFEAVPL